MVPTKSLTFSLLCVHWCIPHVQQLYRQLSLMCGCARSALLALFLPCGELGSWNKRTRGFRHQKPLGPWHKKELHMTSDEDGWRWSLWWRIGLSRSYGAAFCPARSSRASWHRVVHVVVGQFALCLSYIIILGFWAVFWFICMWTVCKCFMLTWNYLSNSLLLFPGVITLHLITPDILVFIKRPIVDWIAGLCWLAAIKLSVKWQQVWPFGTLWLPCLIARGEKTWAARFL